MLKKSTKSTKTTKNNKLLSRKELIKELKDLKTQFIPDNLEKKALITLAEVKQLEDMSNISEEQTHNLFQLMLVGGLENDSLIQMGVCDLYKGFSIQLYLDILKEFNCKTKSEKMLAFAVVQNFMRTLELQRYIKLQLDRDTFTDMSTRRLAVLEKAYDRACRQHENSLFALKSYKFPSMQIKVTANTANIANQQIVSESHNEKA